MLMPTMAVANISKANNMVKATSVLNADAMDASHFV